MRSLRRQLTFGLLVAFALLLGGGGTLVYWASHDSLHDQFDSSLRVKALIVITNTEQKNGRIRVQFSDRFLREFDDDVATDFFHVFDDEGRSIERSDSLNGKDLPLPQHSGSLEEPEYWNLRLPNGEPGRATGIHFEPRFDNRGQDQRKDDPLKATVVVAANRRHLDATLSSLRNLLVGSGVALLALTGAVVPLVLRRGLRPLDRVADQAAKIDATSLKTRFAVETLPVELQPIGGRLNDLLARLEASFERERHFSSDLAHELRTPLAELRSLAELALKWPEERTSATDQAALEIAVQMESLVGRLLALGRAEHGRLPLARESVEIAPLVEELLSSLAPRLTTRELRVERSVPPGAQIATDPVIFRSIVANLLENAVDYTPPGTAVRVTFAREGTRLRLSVANPAPTLQPEDLARMFDRFWRKDTSRTGTEHAGLGLALSRSFAGLLGCELQAALQDDGVLVMTLHGSA